MKPHICMNVLPVTSLRVPEVQAKIHDAMARVRFMPSHSYPILNRKGRRFLLVRYNSSTGAYSFFDRLGFEVTLEVEASFVRAPVDEVSFFDSPVEAALSQGCQCHEPPEGIDIHPFHTSVREF